MANCFNRHSAHFVGYILVVRWHAVRKVNLPEAQILTMG